MIDDDGGCVTAFRQLQVLPLYIIPGGHITVATDTSELQSAPLSNDWFHSAVSAPAASSQHWV